jgi:hypothetical protein
VPAPSSPGLPGVTSWCWLTHSQWRDRVRISLTSLLCRYGTQRERGGYSFSVLRVKQHVGGRPLQSGMFTIVVRFVGSETSRALNVAPHVLGRNRVPHAVQ